VLATRVRIATWSFKDGGITERRANKVRREWGEGSNTRSTKKARKGIEDQRNRRKDARISKTFLGAAINLVKGEDGVEKRG